MKFYETVCFTNRDFANDKSYDYKARNHKFKNHQQNNACWS